MLLSVLVLYHKNIMIIKFYDPSFLDYFIKLKILLKWHSCYGCYFIFHKLKLPSLCLNLASYFNVQDFLILQPHPIIDWIKGIRIIHSQSGPFSCFNDWMDFFLERLTRHYFSWKTISMFEISIFSFYCCILLVFPYSYCTLDSTNFT